MQKAIRRHKKYVLEQIKLLEKSGDAKSLRELAAYHESRVQDFQHERLIHLLVTLFFGALLLVSFVVVVILSSIVGTTLSAIDPTRILLVLATTLSGLLLVVELAYVWHYYQLENGVQGLYAVSEKLQAIESAK